MGRLAAGPGGRGMGRRRQWRAARGGRWVEVLPRAAAAAAAAVVVMCCRRVGSLRRWKPPGARAGVQPGDAGEVGEGTAAVARGKGPTSTSRETHGDRGSVGGGRPARRRNVTAHGVWSNIRSGGGGGAAAAGAGKKRRAKKDRDAPGDGVGTITSSADAGVGRRDTSLSVFHALGKILYNKRDHRAYKENAERTASGQRRSRPARRASPGRGVASAAERVGARGHLRGVAVRFRSRSGWHDAFRGLRAAVCDARPIRPGTDVV